MGADMSKDKLDEADSCAKFTTPAVLVSGWQVQTQIAREVHITKGQINVRGKMVTRGKFKFADYVLYYQPNIQDSIIEAREDGYPDGDEMQQSLECTLEHPVVPVSFEHGLLAIVEVYTSQSIHEES